MAGDGEPLPELTLRIHVRILAEPLHYTIREMVDAARRVFATAGLRIEVASVLRLDRPELRIIDVGECVQGELTPEQEMLFADRDGVAEGEALVYFVREIAPRMGGCAAHPDDSPGALIASIATRWTFAHELGHVLGLEHVEDTRRLMIGSGTARITQEPPELAQTEIARVRASPLLHRASGR